MSVVVLSSVYGGYDEPHNLPTQSVPTEHVLVTDRVHESFAGHQVYESRPTIPPVLAAKVAKVNPWLYAPDAEYLIWLDASIEVISSDFVEMMIDNFPTQRNAQIGAFPHPFRTSIAEEADHAWIRLPGDSAPVLAAQVAHYAVRGMDTGQSGLWSCGAMIWRWPGAEWNRRLGHAWLSEIVRWTTRDQISLPYIVWSQDVDIITLPPSPGANWANIPHCIIHEHVADPIGQAVAARMAAQQTKRVFTRVPKEPTQPRQREKRTFRRHADIRGVQPRPHEQPVQRQSFVRAPVDNVRDGSALAEWKRRKAAVEGARDA